MNVLVIEDETKVAAFLKRGLSEAGYQVSVAFDGMMARRLALEENVDIIILDIMLPLVNGFELCKQLRQEGVTCPVLVLSALSAVDDKVEGFQCGADDYMVKPFHFKELLVRLHALTSRYQSQQRRSSNISFSDVELDCDRKIAKRDGREIILTAKEYSLLELFMRNHDKVLSRAMISEKIWGYGFDPSSNVIDVYVNYLRKKLEKGFKSRLIHTLVGMGYIMKEEQ